MTEGIIHTIVGNLKDTKESKKHWLLGKIGYAA